MLDQNNSNILRQLLSQHFDNVQLSISDLIDAQATVRNTNVTFYVIYHNPAPTDATIKDLFRQVDKLPNSYSILQHTIVVITKQENQHLFFIMSYNDMGRCYLNKRISSWRKFTDENDLVWLNQQLQIRRNHIAILPESMWRIKKTIFLNDDDINEGEVVYFRSLSQDYKMNGPQAMTVEDRFNRIVHGTPEDEYPRDKLDEIILQKIVERYPNAKVKSATFLFTTDLANLRIKKEKEQYNCDMYFLPIFFQDQWNPIVDEQNQVSIKLEVLYYPDIFSRSSEVFIDQVVTIDEETQPAISRLIDTYQPLSIMNI